MNVPSPLVLVFDRDPGVRSGYRAAFGATDYQVVEARDGGEAVTLVSRRLPDLIITELRAHHHDGLTLCLVKRSNMATLDIPMLMIVPTDDPDVGTAARLAGASALLTTPASPTDLLAASQRLLLATLPKDATRRRLYRTLAELREHASASTPEAAITGGPAQLLMPVAYARSSVVIANDDGTCAAANAAACELTGYGEAELLGQSVWDLARADAVDQARMMWGRFLVIGDCAGQFVMVRKDGSEMAIQLCAEANIVPGLHAIVVDRQPIEA